ncbi:hemolysin family protein [Aurantimicrobium sp. MWH-Uga1]|uniref:hemolysin family protein n=1 Tax=Aurantimicrobium sp. MWH-Uga1 TaxID=2079575 RepID=UPI000DEDC3D9|nr:hemolysin family protein [Aurantimicrobium sp. MWH-Uga1]AXE54938.1 Hemolysin C [Aurantimicrobium sp. MWH-Uga1]
MSDWAGLIWLVVLLAVNAFFVAAEFAVISARRSQIEPLAQKGKASAKTALYAMEHVSLMLATSQLGITVASLLILNVSEPAIHHLMEMALYGTGLAPGWISAISFTIALVLVTFLHVIFGEMVPKNASFSVPDKAILILAPPLVFIARVVKPVIWVMNEIANGVLKLCRVEPRQEANSVFTLNEVATIVSHSTREGTIEDSSGTLSAAFDFTTKKAGDIKVSLDNLVTLSESSTVSELEQAVAKYGFSRYVISDAQQEPMGYIHLKDVLTYDDDISEAGTHTGPIKTKRIRQLASVSESTDLEDVLAQLQRTGIHLARVVDAKGETTGVLFLEDIIEELVGEVNDATRRW